MDGDTLIGLFQELKLGRSHLRLSREVTLELVPGLEPKGLVGSVAFDEWGVPPLELVAKNLESAARYGGRAVEGTAVEGLLREGDRVAGVRIRGPEGSREVRARLVVNAAGPWVNEVAGLGRARVPLRVRRGTHLVYRDWRTPVGLLLEAVDRKRVVFVLPFEKETLIGPTDVKGVETGEPRPSDDGEDGPE